MSEAPNTNWRRWVAFVLVLLGIGLLFSRAVKGMLPEKSLVKIVEYEPWSEEVLDAARGIPVQDGGRVKPLETYAGYKMLGMRGDRRMTIKGADDKKIRIKPTAWIMDALFRPELAVKLPTFRIDNSEVLDRIGLKGRAKRDRYSYEEVNKARAEMFKLATEYEQLAKDDIDLDTVQKQTLALARSVRAFEALLGYFSFVRAGVELAGAGVEGSSQLQRTSTVMATAEVIQGVLEQARTTGQAPPTHVQDILRQMTDHSNAARYGLVMLPPSDEEKKEWVTAGTRIWDVMMAQSADVEVAVADIGALENLVLMQYQKPDEFAKALLELRKGPSEDDVTVAAEVAAEAEARAAEAAEARAAADADAADDDAEARAVAAEARAAEAAAASVAADADAFLVWSKPRDGDERENSGLEGRAEARDEFSSVPLELSYNKANWFFRALFLLFLPACIFVVLGWLAPKTLWGRVMRWLVWGFTSVGLVMTIIGMTQRSLIMDRPPVGNLYDTMPYITAGGGLLILIVEGLTRRGLALGLAPIMGFVGLTMARLYEFGDASDPMDPLLAVLRSNYWLTTHVLSVTAGYFAGLVAAGLSLVYLFLRMFKLDGGDTSVRRALTRMVYGVLCFTLLLSLIGTVLGGVWANDSWGRFWGWDPKENGALMIVLWVLFILHARMGGILREWGLHLATIFLSAVITFSWWHVNLLGVGLHSYGFSDSKKAAVFWFYGIIGAVLFIGIGMMIHEKLEMRAKRLAKAAGDGVRA